MRQRRESHSGAASSVVRKKKEDRRREAIGFEIPVMEILTFPATRALMGAKKGCNDAQKTNVLSSSF